MENYVTAKRHIFSRNNQRRVLGSGDNYTLNVSRQLTARFQSKANILHFGLEAEKTEGVWVHDNRIHIRSNHAINDFGNTTRYHSLRGEHNHQNIAAAISLIIHLYRQNAWETPDWNLVDKSLQEFQSLPHRQQLVLQKPNLSFINDSKATNIDSAKRSLNSFENILWIGGGKRHNEEILFEKKHVKNVAHCFFFGESRKKLAEAIKELKPVSQETTLESTLKQVKSYIDEHKDLSFTILLAPGCTSFDQFTDFEARGEAYIQLTREIFA